MAQRPLDGLGERSPDWHYEHFVDFTRYKGLVGEPSPHLAIVGYLSRKMSVEDRLWLLGLYAAAYCLPTAQVLHSEIPLAWVRANAANLETWLRECWPGVVTRTERRCVRTPKKMAECLLSLVRWIDEDYEPLTRLPNELTPANYDVVWESTSRIKFFGRYILIRFIEGLRRYCGIPAMLYDVRSIGAWSPKRCLCYLYPEHKDILLTDSKEGDILTDKLAYDMLARVKEHLPNINTYILAALLCEYKSAWENRHQFVGWTISQEDELHDKVKAYWGARYNSSPLWEARKYLFPSEVLGELNDWRGIRWPLTKTLRDHGYVWCDLIHDWSQTTDFANPKERINVPRTR